MILSDEGFASPFLIQTGRLGVGENAMHISQPSHKELL